MTNKQYCESVIKFEGDTQKQFLVLGKHLSDIYHDELWKDGYTSFADFYNQFKFLSQPVVSKLINIYDKFIVEFKLPEDEVVTVGGWTYLAEILPLATSKTEAKRWLKKAGTMTRAEIREFKKKHFEVMNH